MRDVYIIGVHTLKFGKYLERSIKSLAGEAALACIDDGGIAKSKVEALWFSNSGWGQSKMQTSIRGQVALRPVGIEAIPITNVENACAGGSTAFHGAWMGVASGLYDVTMAVGAEKLYHKNKLATFAGFIGGLDAEDLVNLIDRLNEFAPEPGELPAAKPQPKKREGKKKRLAERVKDRIKTIRDTAAVGVILGEALGYDVVKKIAKVGGTDRSPFMDVYAYIARWHMKQFGSTQRQLAIIASKNHFHSTLNPNAQYTFPVSVDEALNDRLVSYPLTRSMCAPIGDGAAAAILCSAEVVRRLGVSGRAVKVRASVLGSGRAREFTEVDIGERLSKLAYERAGLGPEDISFAEVHDATAFGELHQCEALGFCALGEGGIYAESGETRLGGARPINPSGGLESRGHPIGASGLAQIHELVTQLRGEAGSRQVKNAVIGLAENGGGVLGNEEAAMCVHIFEAPAGKSH